MAAARTRLDRRSSRRYFREIRRNRNGPRWKSADWQWRAFLVVGSVGLAGIIVAAIGLHLGQMWVLAAGGILLLPLVLLLTILTAWAYALGWRSVWRLLRRGRCAVGALVGLCLLAIISAPVLRFTLPRDELIGVWFGDHFAAVMLVAALVAMLIVTVDKSYHPPPT